MKVLPDSSIWIPFLRDPETEIGEELTRLLRRKAVLVCGPVLAELVAGAPDAEQAELWLAIGHLPWADLDHEAWREIGEVGHLLRRHGQWVPQTDVAIAVAGVRADAAVWTRDQDFRQIQQALPALGLYAP